eukprot:5102805-Prymnesium_polylepis.1
MRAPTSPPCALSRTIAAAETVQHTRLLAAPQPPHERHVSVVPLEHLLRRSPLLLELALACEPRAAAAA